MRCRNITLYATGQLSSACTGLGLLCSCYFKSRDVIHEIFEMLTEFLFKKLEIPQNIVAKPYSSRIQLLWRSFMGWGHVRENPPMWPVCERFVCMGMFVALRCLGATYLDNFGWVREARVCGAVHMCFCVLQPVNLQDKNPCLVVGRLPGPECRKSQA